MKSLWNVLQDEDKAVWNANYYMDMIADGKRDLEKEYDEAKIEMSKERIHYYQKKLDENLSAVCTFRTELKAYLKELEEI